MASILEKIREAKRLKTQASDFERTLTSAPSQQVNAATLVASSDVGEFCGPTAAALDEVGDPPGAVPHDRSTSEGPTAASHQSSMALLVGHPSPMTPISDNDDAARWFSSDEDPDCGSASRRQLAKRRTRVLLKQNSNTEAMDKTFSSIIWMKEPEFPSLSWWVTPSLVGAAPYIERQALHGPPSYRPRLMLNCAGTAGELYGIRALGIPFSTDVVANELNKARRTFLVRQHTGWIRHLFSSMGPLCDKIPAAWCDICDDNCILTAAETEWDWQCGGSPCPPFTPFRNNTAEVKPEDHGKYLDMFGDARAGTLRDTGSFLATVEVHRPGGGHLEEVEGFLLKDKHGVSPCDKAVQRILDVPLVPGSSGGGLYAVRVVLIRATSYANLKRTRRAHPTGANGGIFLYGSHVHFLGISLQGAHPVRVQEGRRNGWHRRHHRHSCGHFLYQTSLPQSSFQQRSVFPCLVRLGFGSLSMGSWRRCSGKS